MKVCTYIITYIVEVSQKSRPANGVGQTQDQTVFALIFAVTSLSRGAMNNRSDEGHTMKFDSMTKTHSNSEEKDESK